MHSSVETLSDRTLTLSNNDIQLVSVPVICVVGLPGSGKTYLTNLLSRSMHSIVVDDCSRATLDHNGMQLVRDAIKCAREMIDAGQPCQVIITDPFFCMDVVRQTVSKKLKGMDSVTIWWIYFENNPVKCRNNISLREKLGDNRNVLSSLEFFNKKYCPPSMTTEIWQG